MFRAQLAEKKVKLVTSAEVVHYLAEKGYSHEFGARNVGRLVEDKIKSFFVDEVLFGRLEHGGTAIAELVGDEIVFSVEPAASGDDIIGPAQDKPAADQANLITPAELNV